MDVSKSDIAKMLGKSGGNATKAKYGPDHFSRLAKKSHKKRAEEKRKATRTAKP